MKCCENDCYSEFLFTAFHFIYNSQWCITLHQTGKAYQGQTLQLAGPIKNTLACRAYSYVEKKMKCYENDSYSKFLFTAFHFTYNSQCCVTLHQAGKACQGQTLQLVGPIQKFKKKMKFCQNDSYSQFLFTNFIIMNTLGWICLQRTSIQACWANP